VSLRAAVTAAGLAVLLYLALFRAPAVASLDEAQSALRAGRYADAIEAFEREASSNPSETLYRGWVSALSTTGAYEEALSVIDRFDALTQSSAALANLRGEILHTLGRIEEAREAFLSSVSGKAKDALEAELNLAILLYEEGAHDEALARFDRFIDVYNGSSRLSSEDLVAVAIACKFLGVTDPQLFKDALRAFDEAKAKDASGLDPAIRTGELFLEKYNGADAQESFQEALSVNPNQPDALLGLAKAMDFAGSADAMELTKKALEVNPKHVAARAFYAEQLLGLEDYQGARREADAALEVNPVSPDALPILAAAELLSGNEVAFRAVEERALARNPRAASFYNKLSEIAVNNRLYREARDFAAKAVELDPRSFVGLGFLGLNQLRLGQIEEGRQSLERSFEGDPYNVWIKNTLDLLDTYPSYVTTRSERFEIVIDGKESDLLSVYFERIANEAFDKLSERYDYAPPTPIRIEVYPSHGDFSVRTLGLPGLGALGVCFGSVVALDSPSARPRGQFNWASTLWHELGHAVTLGATDHKVPRWFSEGLSVLEERRARPGWGDDVSLPFLAAYKRGKLLNIAELNNGFMRPTYPQQVGISYYQASLVSELIERDFGFAAIRDMLARYREGLATVEVFRQVLKMELSEFDARFGRYLEERFGAQANSLRLPSEDPAEGAPPVAVSAEELRRRAEADDFDFIAHLETGRQALEAGETDRAEKHLERARTLFPEYAEDGGPYLLLAQIHTERGDLAKAAAELQELCDLNENHYDAHLKLAEVYQKLGKMAEAAAILERAMAIYPFDAQSHQKLAALYQELGKKEEVIVERRALLALTTDRAQGLYDLALAYYEAGDTTKAKRELLKALELAPAFKEGLALLSKLASRSEG
jgi:tetratricopeptide (TPR) repeat protein